MRTRLSYLVAWGLCFSTIGLLPGSLSADDQDQRRDQDALRSYYSANGLLNRGLYDLAAKEYRQFLQDQPEHEKTPVARYGLAVCLFRTGQMEPAAAELTVLLDVSRFEFAAETRALLGQCYCAANRFDKAVEVLSDLASNYRDHALADDGAALLVEACYRGGDASATLTNARRFEKRWPDNPLRERVWLFAGLARVAHGEYAEAAALFEKLLKEFPETAYKSQAALMAAQCYHQQNDPAAALRRYHNVLEAAESEYTPDALYGAATILNAQGQADEAARLLDRFVERYASHTLYSDVLMLQGRIHYEQKRFDRAAECFTKAAQIRKDSAWTSEAVKDVQYWLARCEMQMEQPTQAVERLEQTLYKSGDSPRRAEMRYDLAVALTRVGRDEDAARTLREFLAENNDHALAPNALALLASLEHRRENYAASLKSCAAYLERFATHAEAASIVFLAGENLYLSKRYEDALDIYRDFLGRYPNDAQAAKARYRLGLALFQLERYDEALTPLRDSLEWTEKETAYRPCRLALGEIYFRQGHWTEAEAQFDAYLKDGLDAPNADDALLKLGLCRQRQQKHDEAQKTYERLIEHFAESPAKTQAMFELGQTLVARDRAAEARSWFEKVLEREPQSRFAPYALNYLGNEALRRNENEQAAKYFKQAADAGGEDGPAAEALYQRGEALLALRDFAAARDVFTEFLNRFGTHELASRAQARQAIALARLDQPEEALNAIAKAEAAPPDALEPTTLQTLLIEKGECLKKLKRTDEAGAVYRSAGERSADPQLQAYALLELARIEAEKKNFEPATKLLERARAIQTEAGAARTDETRARCLYYLGACQFELQHYTEAAAALEEFLADYPEHALTASASYFCGAAMLKLDKPRPAAEHFVRIVEKYPDDAGCASALLQLGEAQAALQRWTDSEQAFTRYLQRNPDDEAWYQARFGVGWACENQQRYEEAIAAYRDVVQRHNGPTAARAQFQIGECLFALKRPEEAARELLKVDILYAYPEWSAAALYEAGRCFEQMNQLAEARTQYTNVREKFANTHWAELAGQRLDAVAGGGLPGRAK